MIPVKSYRRLKKDTKSSPGLFTMWRTRRLRRELVSLEDFIKRNKEKTKLLENDIKRLRSDIQFMRAAPAPTTQTKMRIEGAERELLGKSKELREQIAKIEGAEARAANIKTALGRR